MKTTTDQNNGNPNIPSAQAIVSQIELVLAEEDPLEKLRDSPPPSITSRQDVTVAVSSAFAARPRPRPRPLSRPEVTNAVATALTSRPTLLTKDEITAAVTTALVPAVEPLTKDKITSAVTDAFAPALELTTLRERVKWMELDRERLQQELKAAKAEIADWKEKSPRGWKP